MTYSTPPPTATCRRPALPVFLLAVALCALAAHPAAAAIFRVDGASGSDGGACGAIGSPCATIQRAVDLASDGDSILVAEGIYVDDNTCLSESAVVCVFQKQVNIVGGYAAGNWSSPDPVNNVTIIDGQDTRRGILVRRGGSDPGLPETLLRLEGFTVRRGYATGTPAVGGGLKANFADVGLMDVVFDDNLVLGGSGGLAGGGGAAILSGGDVLPTVTLERVSFTNNQATGGGGTGGVGIGGGLLIDRADVALRDVSFSANTATGGSSGSEGKDGLGGAAAFSFGTLGTLEKLQVVNNTAHGGDGTSTGGGAFGGGLFFEGGDGSTNPATDLTLTDSIVLSNSALGGDGPGGGGGGAGGGINVFASRLTVERSEVRENLAQGGVKTGGRANAGGGGVFFEWPFGGTPPLNEVINSVVADNLIDGSQGGGGGLRLLGTKAFVDHTTLVDNRILGSGFGSGILVGPRLSAASTLDMNFSILADHGTGRALHVQETPNATSYGDLRSVNFFVGNASDSNYGLANSGSYLGYPGDNLFDPDPSDFFLGPANGDYHVDGTQPPTNSATGSSQALDLDGAARSGSRDIGADEFGAVAYLLQVGRRGSGSGLVTSSPSGIFCNTDCIEAFAEDTVVNLTADPASGSVFSGWSGDTDCADGSVTMTQDLECVAEFNLDGAGGCNAEFDTLLLTGGQTVNNTVTEEACVSIVAGPYTVGSNGDVTFVAPEIEIRNGFVVDGEWTAVNAVP